jgi:DNA-binding NarL/FixJ family response regulator
VSAATVGLAEKIGDPRALSTLGDLRGQLDDADGRAALTAAELRVAEAAAAGRTNREIAAALFLSVRTVETHLASVYRKLGLRTRTQLALAFTDQSAPMSA